MFIQLYFDHCFLAQTFMTLFSINNFGHNYIFNLGYTCALAWRNSLVLFCLYTSSYLSLVSYLPCSSVFCLQLLILWHLSLVTHMFILWYLSWWRICSFFDKCLGHTYVHSLINVLITHMFILWYLSLMTHMFILCHLSWSHICSFFDICLGHTYVHSLISVLVTHMFILW